MYKIKCKNKEIIEIDDFVIERCMLLKYIIENTIVEDYLPLDIDYSVLKIILKFMHKNKTILSEPYDSLEIYLTREDLDFLESYSTDELLNIINGCNYLQYNLLLEMGCKVLANRLNNTQPNTFINIDNGKDIDDEFEWISSSYDIDF